MHARSTPLLCYLSHFIQYRILCQVITEPALLYFGPTVPAVPAVHARGTHLLCYLIHFIQYRFSCQVFTEPALLYFGPAVAVVPAVHTRSTPLLGISSSGNRLSQSHLNLRTAKKNTGVDTPLRDARGAASAAHGDPTFLEMMIFHLN